MTKTVLAFGDSLTFGAPPSGLSRHTIHNRWPQVLKHQLHNKIDVIEEALCGRTTAYDDFTAIEDRNGARILPTLLGSHQPLDLVMVMLGTNDLKSFIAGSAFAANAGMRRLIEIIRTHPYRSSDRTKHSIPEIIIISPPHMVETANTHNFADFNGKMAQSKKISLLYSDLAEELQCGFFDAASVAVASPEDGVHLDENNTKAIGKGLAPLVQMVLGL